MAQKKEDAAQTTKKPRQPPIRRKMFERLGGIVDDITTIIPAIYALRRDLSDNLSNLRDEMKTMVPKIKQAEGIPD